MILRICVIATRLSALPGSKVGASDWEVLAAGGIVGPGIPVPTATAAAPPASMKARMSFFVTRPPAPVPARRALRPVPDALSRPAPGSALDCASRRGPQKLGSVSRARSWGLRSAHGK